MGCLGRRSPPKHPNFALNCVTPHKNKTIIMLKDTQTRSLFIFGYVLPNRGFAEVVGTFGFIRCEEIRFTHQFGNKMYLRCYLYGNQILNRFLHGGPRASTP